MISKATVTLGGVGCDVCDCRCDELGCGSWGEETTSLVTQSALQMGKWWGVLQHRRHEKPGTGANGLKTENG